LCVLPQIAVDIQPLKTNLLTCICVPLAHHIGDSQDKDRRPFYIFLTVFYLRVQKIHDAALFCLPVRIVHISSQYLGKIHLLEHVLELVEIEVGKLFDVLMQGHMRLEFAFVDFLDCRIGFALVIL
jgi:hypothetical protein